ncbi:MAG TPA: hypothetical protein VLA29_03740 [Acidimicrobiia bacterium]|nr:hypothetical protein [Acidimicrobiia bacterium]
MTPHAYHQNDRYLNAYLSELSSDLRGARATESPVTATRRTLARTMVKMGTRMSPDTSDAMRGELLVLTGHRTDDSRRAA